MIEKILEGIDEAEEAARIEALIDGAVSGEEQKKERRMAAGRRRAQDPEWRTKHAKMMQSNEWKAKHAEANRRRAQDPEWRAKHAEANRRRAQDPEWKAKHVKMVQDPEWKSKNAEANRRLAQDPEWRAKQAEGARKMAIPVVCVETKKIYAGARQIEKYLMISNTNIIRVCRGRAKTAGGYHWRYATPEEVAEFRASQAADKNE